jgi:hypothetical protein
MALEVLAMIDIELIKDISMFTVIGGGIFGTIAYTTKTVDRIKNSIAVKKERTGYPRAIQGAIQEEGWERITKIDENTYLKQYGKRVVFDRKGKNNG